MYLKWPEQLNAVTACICQDMEQGFSDAVEGRLEFMRQRGVTDPYELSQIRQDFIGERLPNQQLLLDKYLTAIPAYLDKQQCSDDEFMQAWALMGGIWNVVEFERIRNIVRIQYKYPQVLQVAKVMGRVADVEGPARIPLGVGGRQPVYHGSPSDIDGVGVGNDLTSLLPSEMVQMTDDELEGLFAYKFATHRLQTFSHRSRIMHPSHKIRLNRARPKGPMVVCLDTSASMQGVPEEIGHSLVVKLLQLAMQQNRDLLLIPFAVNARPFDVRKNRTRLLEFFRKRAEGDTDATAMTGLMIHILCERPEYGGADVLLVSDFQIPMVSERLQGDMRRMREQGTRFYGLQIGETRESHWPDFFDRIYRLPYESRMRPWYIQK